MNSRFEIDELHDGTTISSVEDVYSSPFSSSSLKFDKKCKINKNDVIKRAKSTFPFGKCKVCSDKATGVHYGVATCEGCKGFFKRSTLRKEQYRCYFGSKCPLMPENRNRCKACRFNRCLSVGMSIEAVKMGRIPKAEKEKALIDEHEKLQESARSDVHNYQSLNNYYSYHHHYHHQNQIPYQEQNYQLIHSNYYHHHHPHQQYASSNSSSSSSSSSLSSPPLSYNELLIMPKYNSHEQIDNNNLIIQPKNQQLPSITATPVIKVQKENDVQIIVKNDDTNEVKQKSSNELELNNLINQMHSLYIRDNEKVFNLVQQARLYGTTKEVNMSLILNAEFYGTL